MTKNKINVLVFTRDFPTGMAGAKRIKPLLNYIIERNIIVNVISFRGKTLQAKESGVDNKIPFINIGMMLDFRLKTIHKLLYYYAQGLLLISRLRKKGLVNIIYCYGGVNIENLVFLTWARLLNYKLIFDICEDYSFFEDETKLISKFKIWTIKQLDHITCQWAVAIVTISYYLRDKYLHKVKSSVVRLIPITAEENHEFNKTNFSKPLLVLYAGSFDLKDGVDDIISGFTSFNNSFPDAKLILTGKSDQQEKYQQKYQDYLNIEFTGYIPDNEFYALLKKSDVLCMCRTNSGFANAGFPFKLGEYLATGNPVIATKTTDVDKYLTPKDAYLIDPNSPQQICKSLIQIVNNPQAALQVGRSGMSKCREYFSPQVTGELFYDLILAVSQG